MEEFLDFFKIKKNLINLLLLAILVVGLPLGTQLVRQQQILKSQAANAEVEFVEGTCIVARNNTRVATCKDNITLKLTSPYGIQSSSGGSSGSSGGSSSGGTSGSSTTGNSQQTSSGTQTGSSTVTTCKGETKTWDQICAELKGASYNRACVPGDAVALKDYDEAACPGPATVPAGTICENDPPQAVAALSGGLFEKVHYVADCSKFCPNNNAPDRGGCPTNPATDYAVSRKDSAWCFGFDSKGTNRCLQLQNGRACTLAWFGTGENHISDSCVTCIANNRPDIATAYNGPFGQGNCSLRRQINDWCLKVDPSSCTPIRSGSGACSAACGAGITTSIPSPKILGGLVSTVYADHCTQEQVDNGECQTSWECVGRTFWQNENDGTHTDKGEVVGECGVTAPPPPGGTTPPPPGGTAGAGACRDNPPNAPLPAANYKWKALCNQKCANNNLPDRGGCPKRIGDPNVDPAQSNWCYGFEDANYCLQLQSTAGTTTPPPPGGTAPPPPGGTTPPPPPGTGGGTTYFRFAENPTALAAAAWQTYTTEPTTVQYNFTDSSSGKLFVYAEFKNAAGQITPKTVNIDFVGPPPAISTAVCNLDTSGAVNINITGANLGATQGTSKVTANNNSTTITSWNDTLVVAQLSNIGSGAQTLALSLQRSDGAPAATASCTIGVSQVSLGASLFCHAPNQGTINNVDITLLDVSGNTGVGSTASSTAGGRVKEKISISKDGIITGLKAKLQQGKTYKLAIKAPGSLRRVVPFTAVAGTTVIPNLTLPVGDIFPVDAPDGKVNSLDKGELNRQWVVATSKTGRSGDFNQDGRVNSIDWACMRDSFKSPDDEPDL